MKPVNYLKNVMKSVVYSASDVSGEYLSTVKEFKETNKEFTTATFSALKNPKALFRKQVEAIQDSKVFKALDYGVKNTFEDLRTGNFYNKERKERDELKLSGLDSDFDDLSEFGIDDDWESKTSSSDEDGITAGDMKIVESIEGSNAALASATVNAVISGSESNIKAGRANTAMIYAQNEKLFGGIHKDITILGNTMNEMYKIQSASLQNIDKNISDFFTNEAKLSSERNAMLKEILEIQRNMYKSADDKTKGNIKQRKRIRWSDINSGGIPNISEYFSAVKKNFADQLSSVAGMPSLGEDSNMLAEAMISPMEYVLEYVVKGIIPSSVKMASKELNNSFKGIFSTLIARLANAKNDDEGGIGSLLGKFFGIRTSVNRNIDTSKYEKGPVPFDGITRKAITEVIPAHLRRIEAALTGKQEQIYDYKSGRWTTMADVKKKFDAIESIARRSATSDLMSNMQYGISYYKKGLDRDEQNDFNIALNEFQQFLMDRNGIFNPDATPQKNKVDYKYTYFRRYYKVICNIYKNFDLIVSQDNDGKSREIHTKNSVRTNITRSVQDAKDNLEKQYRNMESEPGNIFSTYYESNKTFDKHGKYNENKKKFKAFNTLDSYKDSYGNTVFNYLQNINRELSYMRQNGGYFNNSTNFEGKPIDINSIDIRNSSLKTSVNSINSGRDNDRRRINENIKKGQAMDVRDFDVDEKGANAAFTEILSANAIKQFKSEMENENNSALSNKMEKAIYKNKSIEDVNKAMQKANKEGKNNSNNIDKKEESFLAKLIGKVSKGETFLGGLMGASAEAFTNVLWAADKAIYEMMFKTEFGMSDEKSQKYKGFIDMMANKIKDSFNSIKDKIVEDIINPFKKRLGLGDDVKDKLKGSVKNAAGKLWTAFKDANAKVYGPAFHEAKIAMGLAEGETIAQKKRKENREDIHKKILYCESVKNLFDPAFGAIMREYNLRPTDYMSLEEARSAILAMLYKDMYKNSKNLTEIADGGEYLDDALKYLSTDIKELNKVGKTFGTTIEGTNVKEISANIKKEAKRYARNTRSKALNSRDKNQAKNINTELIKYGFYGTLEERKERLKELSKEYNKPITDEHLNKLTTIEAVNKTALRLISNSNAKGTTGIPFSGMTTLTKGEGLINGGGFGVVPKTGVYNVTTPTHIINTEDMHSITGGPRVSVQQALGKERLAAKAAGYSIDHNDEGTLKISDNSKIDAKTILEEAKKYIPEAAGTGIIGGILSLVLGLAGGPLVGAAIGAGGSIISQSNVLKDKLFGKMDENNQRKGGIIPKTVTDTVKKYFPDMANYGMAGLIPGLLTPLGPIGGILVGSAFGFLKNNERFTNKYFGEEGKLTIKSKEKAVIEKLMPGATKGAIAGVIGTLFLPSPFGILGNAVLGAGIGMMGTTNEFKDFILGTEINGERMGGLVQALKDGISPFTNSLKEAGEKLVDAFDKNIIDPLAKFIKPAIHAVPTLLGLPFKKLGDMIDKNNLKGKIKRNLETRISRSKVGKAAGKVVKGAASLATLPMRGIGFGLKKAGNKLNAFNIAHGNLVDMTAPEAVKFMEDMGLGNKVSEGTKFAARIGNAELGDKAISVENANKMMQFLTMYGDNAKTAQNRFNNQNKEFNSFINGFTFSNGKKLSDSQVKYIIKLAKHGTDNKKYQDKLRKALTSGSDALSEIELNELFSGNNKNGGLKEKFTNLSSAKYALDNFGKLTDSEVISKLEELGFDTSKFDLTKRSDREDAIKQIRDRVNYFELNDDQDEAFKLATEDNQNIKDILGLLTDTNKILYANNHGMLVENIAYTEKVSSTLDTEKLKMDKIHEKNKEEAINIADKDENGNTKLTEEALDKASAGNSLNAINKIGTDAFNSAASGNVKNVIAIATKLKGYFSSDAIEYLSSLEDYKAKNLSKIINNRDFIKLIKASKFQISKNDIDLLLKLGSTELDEFHNTCKVLNEIFYTIYGGIFGEYSSLSDIINITPEDKVNLYNKYHYKTKIRNRKVRNKITNAFNWAKKTIKNINKSYEMADFFESQYGMIGDIAKKYNIKNYQNMSKEELYNAIKEAKQNHENNQRTIQEAVNTVTNNNEAAATEDNSVESHGIGTMILGEALKGLGRLATGAVKGVAKGAKAIVTAPFKLAKSAANKIKGIFNGDGQAISPQATSQAEIAQQAAAQANGATSGAGEVDKQGDGKSILHMDGTDYGTYKRDSSGNVKPDTSDSHTKAVLNKIGLKEKVAEKLRNAQMKACETIRNTFDTSKESGSKGGKFGWFKLLLTGAFLAKSGLLKKLYTGVIKPIWVKHLWPFIRDKAWPKVSGAIKSVASNTWDFITSHWDKIKEKLEDLWAWAEPKLQSVASFLIDNLADKLPSLIWSGIKFGGKLAGHRIKDSFTNKDGKFTLGSVAKGALITATGGIPGLIGVSALRSTLVGEKTKDTKTISADKDDNTKTNMTDENGNALTFSQIANGDFKEIYNADGEKGTVDENGEVSFTGSTGNDTTAEIYTKGMSRAFARGMYKGGTTFGVRVTKAGMNKLASSSILRPGKKIAGKLGQSAVKPFEKAENFGATAGKSFIDKTVDNAVEKSIAKATANGASDEALVALKKQLAGGDGSKASKIIDKISSIGTKKTGEDALKSATKNATKVGKEGGIIKKLISKAKDAIEGLFSSEKVVSKLKSVASALGETNVGKWVTKFKSSLQNIFDDALEKGIKKVGSETTKKVMAKALSVVFLVTDFVTGCDQAESILGVTETSVIEELTAGLINALCNFLIIPSIFPGTNAIARLIFKLFNKDLSERQAEADKEYNEYINKTGKTISKEEYLKRKYSVTGKIGGFVSDVTKKTKNSIKKKLKNNFTNKDGKVTFGSTIKGIVKTGYDISPAGVIVNSGKAVAKGAKKLWNKAKGLFGNAEGTVSFDGIKGIESPKDQYSTIISSTLLSPFTMLKGTIDNITTMMDESASNLTNSTDTNKTINKAKDGKLSVFSKEYWKDKKLNNKKSLAGSLKYAFSKITKFINAPMLMVKDGLDNISSDISTAYEGSSDASITKTASSNNSGKKKKWLSGLFTNLSKFGTGSSYSKQIDPSIANIRYNSTNDSDYQTIGNSGCGPAAAVNVLESMYGRGNAVAGAANFALSHGYKETNGGTKPGFFSDYFNRNGLGSQTTSNRNALERNIKNGMPTVLMGRDAKGTSSSTPFGKNPHYVTVTGMDGKGNAIVQDPESKYDNQLYPLNNLMSKTSLGVSAYGKGGDTNDGSVESQIWWYLKQAGFTDEGAAGMMGNLMGESGLSTNNLEDTANSSLGMTDEEYTAKIDSGDTDDIKKFFMQAQGYGLAQWTSSGRKEGLYNLAKTNNKSIADLGIQLSYLTEELEKSYNGVDKILKSSKNVAETTNTVLEQFERPAHIDQTRPIRKKNADSILNKYKGTEGTELSSDDIINNTASSSSNSSSDSSNAASSFIGILSDIISNSTMGKLISALLGTGSSDSSSTNSSSSSSNNASSSSSFVGGADANSMVEIAKNELGTKEVPDGSNKVKYNNNDGNPWCASFVSWTADQAGVNKSILPRSASSTAIYNGILSNNGAKINNKDAQPGDIVLFTDDGTPSTIYHIGIVSGNSGNGINTIEGNHSDSVAEGHYAYDKPLLVVRPKYATSTTSTVNTANNLTNKLTNTANNLTQKSNSDTSNTEEYTEINHENAYGNNGCKPLSKYGQFRDSIYGTGGNFTTKRIKDKSGKYVKYEYSNLDRSLNRAIKDSSRKVVYSRPKVGMGTEGLDYSKLINAIIKILMTIADNTDKLNTIVSILNSKLGTNITAQDVSNYNGNTESLKSSLANIFSQTSKLNNYADQASDSSMNAIITAMNAIAAE